MPGQVTSRGTNSQGELQKGHFKADHQGNNCDTRVNTSTGNTGYNYSK